MVIVILPALPANAVSTLNFLSLLSMLASASSTIAYCHIDIKTTDLCSLFRTFFTHKMYKTLDDSDFAP